MSQPKLIAVRFLKPWNGYNTGEIAGFTTDHCKKLLDGKVAELNSAKPPVEEPESPAATAELEKAEKPSKAKEAAAVEADSYEKP